MIVNATLIANRFAIFIALLLPVGAVAQTSTSTALPFGGADDVAFARDLWRAMVAARLVGPEAIPLKPFFGGAKPHGQFLEITSRKLTVHGHLGDIVVKRNYDGPGVTAATVAADRDRFLSSINVMYRREVGYDAENQNWFWVKYKPDGTLSQTDTNSRTVALAGRIHKGKRPSESRGCIFCHRSAGGGDYVFYHQIRLFDPLRQSE